MKDSLHDYMKVGIVHFMAYPFALSGEGRIAESVAEIVEDEFFDEIEITRVNDQAERDAVKGLLASSGMTVGFGAQPYILKGKLDLNSTNEEERSKAVDTLKSAIDQAYEVGAGKLGFLSGPRPPAQDRERALELLADSIIELGRYAKSKGDLVLSLETFDDSTDKKALIGTNRLACELAYEVRKAIPDFGLMVDLSHLPMQGETIRQALSATEEFINHAHIGNCVIRDTQDPAYGDLHPHFGHPKGENNVPQVRDFLRGLLDIGYLREDAPERNVVAFEVQPLGDQRAAVIIAEAKRVLREAWRIL
ncbi:sugar phosphate isomerase/epimerase family protein [Actinomyces bowdenii]|uniref:TIM barrel protein n=1 Tax=Actinomyces bowdenii TaxID=131109 RepID=A0A853EJ01_9ACTO|nr:TIM barrel protein [Actinomyces bowdenii]MBF0696572.1 TIM barrel protein [Actinomyces bowdenii]MDO5063566.1 TIM barrel protein [Actinomyces bowdenii]NYS68745.1 TIM barrel protein [Actinomyces bowdenii]